MKKPERIKLLLIAIGHSTAAALLLLSIAGCKSSGYEKQSATGASLRESANRIDLTQKKLDETIASLNDLVKDPKPDLRPQYQTFSGNVNSLDSLAKSLHSQVTSMDTKGKEFFGNWDQQLAAIKNEEIRTRGEARRAEVTNSFANVKRQYAQAELSFQPLLSDLRDIQRYLGTDLTPAGVASIKNTAGKANNDASKLNESLASLTAEFNKLGVSMSSVAPTPPQNSTTTEKSPK